MLQTKSRPIRSWRERIRRFPCLMTALVFMTSTTANAQSRAVVFAPGTYKTLPKTVHHLNAMQRVATQLKFAGLKDDHIVTLSGKEATRDGFLRAVESAADLTQQEDLLLVVALSYGRQRNSTDEIATYSSAEKGEWLPVRSILEEMSISPSERGILIIDGTLPSVPLPRNFKTSAYRFGSEPKPVAQNQCTFISRSHRLVKRRDYPVLSSFMLSYLDGISDHADANRTGIVAIVELADYMRLFAIESDDTPPRFHGRLNTSAALLPSTAEKEKAFPAKAMNENAKKLFVEAKKTLFLDLDGKGSLALLDRARRLCRDSELEKDILRHYQSAQILFGLSKSVVATKPVTGKSWKAVLPRRTGIYRSGQRTPSNPLATGVVLDIRCRVGNFLQVVGAATPKATPSGIVLSDIELPSGTLWVHVNQLKHADNPAVPGSFLDSQLQATGKAVDSPQLAKGNKQ